MVSATIDKQELHLEFVESAFYAYTHATLAKLKILGETPADLRAETIGLMMRGVDAESAEALIAKKYKLSELERIEIFSFFDRDLRKAV